MAYLNKNQSYQIDLSELINLKTSGERFAEFIREINNAEVKSYLKNTKPDLIIELNSLDRKLNAEREFLKQLIKYLKQYQHAKYTPDHSSLNIYEWQLKDAMQSLDKNLATISLYHESITRFKSYVGIVEDGFHINDEDKKTIESYELTKIQIKGAEKDMSALNEEKNELMETINNLSYNKSNLLDLINSGREGYNVFKLNESHLKNEINELKEDIRMLSERRKALQAGNSGHFGESAYEQYCLLSDQRIDQSHRKLEKIDISCQKKFSLKKFRNVSFLDLDKHLIEAIRNPVLIHFFVQIGQEYDSIELDLNKINKELVVHVNIDLKTVGGNLKHIPKSNKLNNINFTRSTTSDFSLKAILNDIEMLEMNGSDAQQYELLDVNDRIKLADESITNLEHLLRNSKSEKYAEQILALKNKREKEIREKIEKIEHDSEKAKIKYQNVKELIVELESKIENLKEAMEKKEKEKEAIFSKSNCGAHSFSRESGISLLKHEIKAFEKFLDLLEIRKKMLENVLEKIENYLEKKTLSETGTSIIKELNLLYSNKCYFGQEDYY